MPAQHPFSAVQPPMSPFRILAQSAWGNVSWPTRLQLVGTAVLIVLGAGFDVAAPYLFKLIVDSLHDAATSGGSALLVLPVWTFLGFVAVRLLSGLADDAVWFVFYPAVMTIRRKAQLAWLDHIQGLSLRFHQSRHLGGLNQTVSTALSGAVAVLDALCVGVLPAVFRFAATAIVVTMLLDWTYLLILVGTLGAFFALMVLGSDAIDRQLEQAEAIDVKARAISHDMLINYETVQLFGGSRRIAERLARTHEEARRARTRFLHGRGTLSVVQTVVLSAGLGALVWLGLVDVVAGRATVGDLVMVNAYLLQTIGPVREIGYLHRRFREGLVSVRLMAPVLAERPEVRDVLPARDFVPAAGCVEFEHVSFAYDPRRPILENVSFRVEPGRTLALVGATGAGKSTIARLLFRFYDVTAGAIRIDGQDIRAVTQLSLRDTIAVVPQDAVLFNDTLRANIAFGRPDATASEIEDAAARAQLGVFIASLPDGYDTVVGERGLKLSGGERQRIAIARALLKRPLIFVFDEATSALDTNTERKIMADLRAASAGTTTLIIAHRLSSIVHADEIVVLDGGRIRERGTHPDLLAQDGLYATLWRRQSQDEGREPATIPGAVA